jgi:hypothetical protein
MNQNCKCPLSSDCNARRGYFDCSKKLLRLVEEKFTSTNIDYTAALLQELWLIFIECNVSVEESFLLKVATRLNSVIKAS